MKKVKADELKNFIKGSVDWLLKQDCGCTHLHLDDKFVLAVGWSDGYDGTEPDIIHSPSQPSYAINARISIEPANIAMQTDFDIDFPLICSEDATEDQVYADSHCIPPAGFDSNDVVLDFIVESLLDEYRYFQKFNIADNGIIIGTKYAEELDEQICDIMDLEQYEQSVEDVESAYSNKDIFSAEYKYLKEALKNVHSNIV